MEDHYKEVLDDSPIMYSCDDKCQFNDIVDAICNIIQKNKGKSFTIGIIGSWGSGKTSLMNLISNRTDHRIKFNPWYFDNEKDLFTQFCFSLLRGLKDESENIKKAAFKWCVGLLLNIGKVIDISDFIKNPLVKKLSKMLGVGSSFVSDLIRNEDSDINELKQKLSNELAGHKPIVVFIDDLDRCMADEIKSVFKLFRLVADFPNIIYVVGFDINQVTKALQTIGVDDGDYISKFIQVPIFLRTPSPVILERIIQERVGFLDGRILKSTIKVVSEALLSIREMNRMLNSFFSMYPIVGKYVNLDDFLLCCFLRTVNPQAFESLSSQQYLFFDCFKGVEDSDKYDKRVNETKNHIQSYEAAFGSNYRRCYPVLCRLFLTFDIPHFRLLESLINDGYYNKRFYCTHYQPLYFKYETEEKSKLINPSYIFELIEKNDIFRAKAWSESLIENNLFRHIDFILSQIQNNAKKESGWESHFGLFFSGVLLTIDDNVFWNTVTDDTWNWTFNTWRFIHSFFSEANSEFCKNVLSRFKDYNIFVQAAILDSVSKSKEDGLSEILSIMKESFEEYFNGQFINKKNPCEVFLYWRRFDLEKARAFYLKLIKEEKVEEALALHLITDFESQNFRNEYYFNKDMYGDIENTFDENLIELIRARNETTKNGIDYIKLYELAPPEVKKNWKPPKEHND